MPDDPAFRLLVVGGFRGERRAGDPPPPRPLRIDRDDFDGVLARLAPEVRVAPGEGLEPVAVRFAALEDFEPDALVARLDLFGEMRGLRARLADRGTFAQAAAELMGAAAGEPPTAPPAPRAPAPDPAPSPGNLLEAALEATADSSEAAVEGTGSRFVDELVRRIVAPYVVPAADPRQAELVDVVDQAVGRVLRALLHAPGYQALEARWRGLFQLVRRLETGTDLQVHVLDRSRVELASELREASDPLQTALGRLLVEEARRAAPWTAWVLDVAFGPSEEDARLLGALARIAEAAQVPLLAGADPRLVGCPSLVTCPDPDDWNVALAPAAAAAWTALRRGSPAGWVSLSLPRFLLRLPYGQRTSPVESLCFEELEDEPRHQHYLWGNSAFAVARALGETFQRVGWSQGPPSRPALEGIPLHVRGEGADAQAQPCAEILLSERAGERIAAQGIQCVWSLRGRDAVQLGELRSLADPPAPLRGPWSSGS